MATPPRGITLTLKWPFENEVKLLQLEVLSLVGISIGHNALINSLTTEKQTTKFLSANFQKKLNPSYIILRIQRLEGKQCRAR